MATIVTRAGKASPLTNQELDSNFNNLNTDKAELSGATFTGDVTSTGLVVNNTAGANKQFLNSGTTTTGANYININSTGGAYYLGVENSAGNEIGATAYDFVMQAPSTRAINLMVGSGRARLTSTGLAVTGAIKLFSGTNSPSANSTLADVDFGARTDGTVTARIRGIAGNNGNGTDGQLTFYTADNTASQIAQERARITSDGHFIVGNTSAFSSSSFCVDQSGLGQFRRDGTPLIVRRDGSVGDLISFEDDGTTVGSIGTVSGDLFIDGGSEHTGLRFEGTDITPRHNGALSNGVNDLGTSSARFKDLYLSGGVYLGGTGAANKLSDFEFGTWTPVVTSSGGTITSVTGKVGTYTKIGRTVIVQYQFNIADLGTASGHIIVSGRPFTEDNSVISYYAGVHRARAGASSITEFDPDGTFRLYGTTPVTNVYLGSMVYNTTS